MGFSYHEKGYRLRPIALFIARVRAGPRGDGSARAYLHFLRFIIECTTSLGSLLVATDQGGPDNITCVQYLLIQQFSAIHFANHLVLPVVCDRESFLVVCECRDSDQS